MIAPYVLALSINTLGQKPNSAPEWEIDFGRSWGRFHQNIEKHTVDSNGLITYLNKRNGTPGTRRISEQDVDEITGLLNRLNLQKAKAIPAKDFNKCIVSLHMPTSYFSLTQGGNNYRFSPCKGSGYTLILSAGQEEMYRRLRAKLESLFDDEIRKQAR